LKNDRISDIFLILSNSEGESINMKISDYKFSNSEIENLQKYRDNQINTRLKFRFVALLMLAKGICIETVSIIIGKSKQAIESWFNLYVNKGIESLDYYGYKPKQPYLTFNQINQVVIWVTFNNPQKTKEVRDYILKKFNVDYKVESVRVLLQKYGLKIVKPQLIPGDPPSIEEQERFIEKYTKMREEPESKTLFLDAMHLVHQNIPARCWGDPKYAPVYQTNSGRKRLNILGAYDPETYSIIHDTDEENCNADRVINFLKHILEYYKEAQSIYLISYISLFENFV
jgi:transposase